MRQVLEISSQMVVGGLWQICDQNFSSQDGRIALNAIEG